MSGQIGHWEKTQQQVVTEVRDVTYQEPLGELVEEYNERIGIRDEYLWQWLCTSFPFVTLSSVPEERIEEVCTHKTILSMYITLVDDLAENLRDEATFREAVKIPFEHQEVNFDRDDVRTDYLEFLETVWAATEELLAKTEREEEFRSFFEYDLRQALNAMDYEYIANEYTEMMNTSEMMDYTPHNMVMLAAADIDLMNSPTFDRTDLAAVRETVYRGQQLVRVSNWTSTWQRELEEGDYTSAVFTEALGQGVVTPEELDELRSTEEDADYDAVAARINEHQIEEQLLGGWDQQYADLTTSVPTIDSIDLTEFVKGVETVRMYHMLSKGYK